MNLNWQEYSFIKDKTYNNLEYYGAIEAEFENCTFNSVLFYWNLIDGILFKNCRFENCTFAGVTFIDTEFVKCNFQNCNFTKGKIGSHCTNENSFAVDCIMDEKSFNNNPLSIHKTTQLLTQSLKRRLYKTFHYSRPVVAVDEPKHCLSCDETQETHQKIVDLKQLNVAHFNICYMSVETFSEEAFKYYMPKLLELLLSGKENEWGYFRNGLLRQLKPNKFGDRFKNYNKEQIKLMIDVLLIANNYYSRKEESWDYELDMMADYTMYKDAQELCEKALDFWKSKI